MKATKAPAVHRKGTGEVLQASLKALCCSCGSRAKSAVRSHTQPCKSCRNHQNHTQNIGWSQESYWEGQSHWLTPQKKVDSLVVVTAITPNLDSTHLSISSCSGNFMSGPAFTGEKETARSLTATQLKSCINSKHGEFCLVSYLQLDLPQRLMTAMCHISSLGYPPQSHWDFIQRNSAQCGEW